MSTRRQKPKKSTTEWQQLRSRWGQRFSSLTAAEWLYWTVGVAFTAWLVWHFWLLLLIFALAIFVPHRDTRTDEQRAHDNWVNHWKDRH